MRDLLKTEFVSISGGTGGGYYQGGLQSQTEADAAAANNANSCSADTTWSPTAGQFLVGAGTAVVAVAAGTVVAGVAIVTALVGTVLGWLPSPTPQPNPSPPTIPTIPTGN